MATEKKVFISYRHTDAMTARAVYQDLREHGYDCFLDYQSIDAGAFEHIILGQIAERTHFIVILTPSALERCKEPDDWLRREIECAMKKKRNIVSLLIFDKISYKYSKYLTGDLKSLPYYPALQVSRDTFEEDMERLRQSFLNKSLDVILHPTSKEDQAEVQRMQANEASQPPVSMDELEAERSFEKGYFKWHEGDHDAALTAFNEAIRLNPRYAEAYNNRGNIRKARGDLDGAIADYTRSIELKNSVLFLPYNNRGTVRYDKNDLDGAIADFNEAIRLNPKFAVAYNNRGNARDDMGDTAGAMADYDETIRLDPKHTDAYRNRGILYEEKGDLGRANTDFQRYIDNGGKDADEVREWIRANQAAMRKLR